MTQYKCGHESKLIVADGGALTIAAYLEWRETVGAEGTREKCWDCWCKERNQSSAPKAKMDGYESVRELFEDNYHEDPTYETSVSDGTEVEE